MFEQRFTCIHNILNSRLCHLGSTEWQINNILIIHFSFQFKVGSFAIIKIFVLIIYRLYNPKMLSWNEINQIIMMCLPFSMIKCHPVFQNIKNKSSNMLFETLNVLLWEISESPKLLIIFFSLSKNLDKG